MKQKKEILLIVLKAVLLQLIVMPITHNIIAKEYETTLSLTDLILIAETNNLALKKEVITRTRADIATQEAYHAFLPTVDASIQDRYQYIKSNRVDGSDNSVTLSLGASVNLFNGFKDMNTLKRAQILQQSSQSSYQWKRESICYETAVYYFSILANTEELKQIKSTLKRDEELLSEVATKVKVGEQTQMNYLKQKSETEYSKQLLLEYELQLNISTMKLKKFLDYNIETTLSIKIFEAKGIVERIINTQEDIVRQTAIKQLRYDIQTTALEVEAMNKSYDVEKSGYWPTISLSTSISDGYNDNIIQSIAQELGGDNLNGTASLTFSYKIFNQLATKDKLQDIKQQINTMELEYRESLRNLKYENEESKEYLNNAIAKLHLAQIQLEYSREVWKLTKLSFDNGIITNYELNDAKYSLLNAESNLLTIQYEIIIKWLNLEYNNGTILDALQLI